MEEKKQEERSVGQEMSESYIIVFLGERERTMTRYNTLHSSKLVVELVDSQLTICVSCSAV